MKRYVKTSFSPHAAAMQMVGKTKYEVHWITPDGEDCLLGGSPNIESANRIAMNQAERIFESPWESKENKFKILDSIYIYEKSSDRDGMLPDTYDYIDGLMSELHSRRR